MNVCRMPWLQSFTASFLRVNEESELISSHRVHTAINSMKLIHIQLMWLISWIHRTVYTHRSAYSPSFVCFLTLHSFTLFIHWVDSCFTHRFISVNYTHCIRFIYLHSLRSICSYHLHPFRFHLHSFNSFQFFHSCYVSLHSTPSLRFGL